MEGKHKHSHQHAHEQKHDHGHDHGDAHDHHDHGRGSGEKPDHGHHHADEPAPHGRKPGSHRGHEPVSDEAHAHGHHHADAHAHQPQGKPGEDGSPLSRKEKLIIRLEHDIRHNSQHADASLNLANEAGQIGEEEAARLIRAAAESAARIHEDLQKALSVLKSG